MTPEIANKINLYLNKPEITELLREYVESEVLILQKTLEYSRDFMEVRYIQGRIHELRRLQALRETAIAVTESNRSGR